MSDKKSFEYFKGELLAKADRLLRDKGAASAEVHQCLETACNDLEDLFFQLKQADYKIEFETHDNEAGWIAHLGDIVVTGDTKEQAFSELILSLALNLALDYNIKEIDCLKPNKEQLKEDREMTKFGMQASEASFAEGWGEFSEHMIVSRNKIVNDYFKEKQMIPHDHNYTVAIEQFMNWLESKSHIL